MFSKNGVSVFSKLITEEFIGIVSNFIPRFLVRDLASSILDCEEYLDGKYKQEEREPSGGNSANGKE